MTIYDARRLTELLASLSLVADFNIDRIRLHDVIRAYLRRRGADRLTMTNRAFVDGARLRIPKPAIAADPSPPPWWTLPSDADYLWRYLCQHLRDAGRNEPLAALVTDLRWVEAKLARSGPPAIDLDLDTTADATAEALRRVLRQNAHLLSSIQPPQGLADTLASRLQDHPVLDRLVAEYRSTMGRVPQLSARWPLPDQPHPALRQVLIGHDGSIDKCSIGSDGTWLAAQNTRTGSVSIWDATTGALRYRLRVDHEDNLALSPDGAWLALIDKWRGPLRMLDAVDGTVIHILDDRGESRCLAISPDGMWLAAGVGKTVRIWRTSTGALHRTLKGHRGIVRVCRISPDGTWLASIDDQSTLCMWDAVRGAPLRTIRVEGKDCLVSPDGDSVITIGGSTAQVWDSASGALRFALSDSHFSHTDSSFRLSVSGRYLAGLDPRDRRVRIWDTKAGTLLHDLTGYDTCALSPNDAWMAAVDSRHRAVKVLDLVTGEVRHSLAGHTGTIRACAVSPDGTWLATASGDRTVRVYDPETGNLRQILSGHTREVRTCVVSPDGRWLVTAGDDGTGRIWDPHMSTADPIFGDPVPLVELRTDHGGATTMCAIDPRGSWVAAARADGTARIFDVSNGALIRILSGHTGPVRTCAISPDGSWLTTTSTDWTARIWNSDGTLRHTLVGHSGAVSMCVISPDGTWLVTAGENRTVRIWDTTSGRLMYTLKGHKGLIRACAISPDGSWLVTGSADGTARTWTSGGQSRHMLVGHQASVWACAVSPSGRRVYTASADRTVKVWDAATGLLCRSLVGHRASVRSCTISVDGKRLVTASGDGTARVWDAGTGDPLHIMAGHHGSVTACALSLNGRWLATADYSRTLRIWDIGTGEPQTAVRLPQEVGDCAWLPDSSGIVVSSGAGVYVFTYTPQ